MKANNMVSASRGSAYSLTPCSFSCLLQKPSTLSQDVEGLGSSTNLSLLRSSHAELEPLLLWSSCLEKLRGTKQHPEAPFMSPEGPQLSVSAPKCAKETLIASITDGKGTEAEHFVAMISSI